MSTTPLNFLHGDRSNLSAKAITEGTVYVAKGANNKAYLYVDLDGKRYDISTPNSNYYGISNDDDEYTRTVACDNFALENGITISVYVDNVNIHLDEASLNVNNTGAKPILYRDDLWSGKYLQVGSIYTFMYLNNNYHIIGDLDTNNYGVKVTASSTNANKPIFIANGTTGYDLTGLYNSSKPITANPYYGSMNIPGFVNIGGDGSTKPSLLFDGDYINWTGYSGYGEEHGDWRLYNNGSSLELAEEYHTGMKIMTLTSGGTLTSLDGNFVANNGDFYSKGKRIPRVYSGTSTPSASTGADGDIYIMYE